MKTLKLILLSAILFLCFSLNAQQKNTIRDDAGRQIIPRGFVVNTEYKSGEDGKVYYTVDDYNRMAKMGANYQVVRLKLGRLGGYPDNELESDYLPWLDSLVQMAKNNGIRTDFKMTVYGTIGFTWKDFWRNKNGEQDQYLAAWKLVWNHFKDENYVGGYDLINEPVPGDFDVSFATLEKDYLVPLYKRLIDESQKINPDKKCKFQPILYRWGSEIQKKNIIPFKEMKANLGRENIIYAPHTYEMRVEHIRSTLDRYIKEASRSNTGIFIGEWGAGTTYNTDTVVSNQHEYENFYIEAASAFDSLMVGTIKAWFTGSMRGKENGHTWSVFSDHYPVGTRERKYIVDIICRPYPQQITGTIQNFKYDFATRVFTMQCKPDKNVRGVSRIFIPQDRHYPDGFVVRLNDDIIVQYNPYKNVGLEVVKTNREFEPNSLIFDQTKNQLIITDFPNSQKVNLLVQPGIY